MTSASQSKGSLEFEGKIGGREYALEVAVFHSAQEAEHKDFSKNSKEGQVQNEEKLRPLWQEREVSPRASIAELGLQAPFQ